MSFRRPAFFPSRPALLSEFLYERYFDIYLFPLSYEVYYQRQSRVIWQEAIGENRHFFFPPEHEPIITS